MSSALPFTIIHFNDVYHVAEGTREPVGGIARFTTAVKSFGSETPLVLFSGDAFAPSLDSTITHGEHMCAPLNALGVACAVVGNHDFDFSAQTLQNNIAKTRFPWLCSNALDPVTGRPLLDMARKVVLTHAGVRVGLMGLVEAEWLETLSTLSPADVRYVDFIAVATELVRELREVDGCELIIALTHMREPNDFKLAETVPGIDLVLGGHDHFYRATPGVGPSGVFVVKSGADFHEFSVIRLNMAARGTPAFAAVTRIEVTSAFERDPEMQRVADECNALIGAKLAKVMGHTAVELDTRCETVRLVEAPIGNLFCDIVRLAFDCDMVLLNSGTIRGDSLYPAGPLTLRDLTDILPMEDTMVVLEVTGAVVRAALENAVCKYPAQEGRFAQVSGLRFAFDPSLPPGERVLAVEVRDGVPLDPAATYTLATKEYIARGKDGFDCFIGSRMRVDGEDGMMLPIAVRNHFKMLEVFNQMRDVEQAFHSAARHFVGHHAPHREHEDGEAAPAAHPSMTTVHSSGWRTRCMVAPKVEGRIRVVRAEASAASSAEL